VSAQLTNVKTIGKGPDCGAFAAIKNDGTVVTWGTGSLANSSAVAAQLVNVVSVVGTKDAFAAIKSNGDVVVWGSGISGNTTGLDLTNVKEIFSSETDFVAVKNDNTVMAWGNTKNDYSAEYAAVDFTGGIKFGAGTGWYAFVVVKNDGTIASWGDSGLGTNLGVTFTDEITGLVAAYEGFGAIQSNGVVVSWCWGQPWCDTTAVDFSGGVKKLAASTNAFAAIKNDGSIIAWGKSSDGGDISGVSF
jgi:alpha-tubulin suppressor-like RCC1 family protein